MPKVDLCFTFLGGQVPADHGDLLPAAISRRPPGAEFAAECQQGGRAIECPTRLGSLARNPGDPHAGWFAGRIIRRFPRPRRLQAFPRPGLAPGTRQSPPGYSPVLPPENRPRRRNPAGPERRPCNRLRRRARKQFAGARDASLNSKKTSDQWGRGLSTAEMCAGKPLTHFQEQLQLGHSLSTVGIRHLSKLDCSSILGRGREVKLCSWNCVTLARPRPTRWYQIKCRS